MVRLEVGRTPTWDGSPLWIPLWVQGNPQELAFVVRFSNERARVWAVSSSANWDTRIVRLNSAGEIRVHAVRQQPQDGKERLLTMKFQRLGAGPAWLSVPTDEVEATFASHEPPDVRVEHGKLIDPF